MLTKPVISRLLVLLWLALFVPTTLSQESRTEESSFLDKVLDFLGVSVTTGKLKGPGDEVEEGDIWIAKLDSRIQRIRVTREGGYRSPVFMPKDGDIMALQGDDVVHIPMFGAFSGEPEKLWSIAGIRKIVGLHREDKDKALILRQDESGISVGIFSLTSGEVTPLPYQSEGKKGNMLIHLKGWKRVYGDTKVYVEIQHEIGRPGEWTDVFIKRDDQDALNVSQCKGVNCGQPSLSPDGSQVVYIRAES